MASLTLILPLPPTLNDSAPPASLTLTASDPIQPHIDQVLFLAFEYL